MPNSTNIDKETYKQADKELTDISRLQMMLSIEPNTISINMDPDSYFPVAAICFSDVKTNLTEIRYALLESIAHKLWYREKADPPKPTKGLRRLLERYLDARKSELLKQLEREDGGD